MKFESLARCDDCLAPRQIRGPLPRGRVVEAAFWLAVAATSSGLIFSALHAPWLGTLSAPLWGLLSAVAGSAIIMTSLHLPGVIRRNMVGWRYFLFLDLEGKLHIHRRMPEIIRPTAQGFVNWITDAILEVRSGGWFRHNRTHNTQKPSWRIAYAWDNLGDIRLLDGFRGEIGGLNPECLLKLIDRFNRLEPAAVHFQRVEQVCDHLGRTTLRLIEEIAGTKQTLGRSAHAQMLRQRLKAALKDERAFGPTSGRFIQRWAEQIERQRLVEAHPPQS